MSDIRSQCIALFDSHPKASSSLFVKQNRKRILSLSEFSTVAETVYNWKYPDCRKTCLCCGKITKFISSNDGYRKSCSRKCGYIVAIDQREQTNLEKFGVKYLLQRSDKRAKYNATCIEKYGVDHTFKLAEVKTKSVQTMIERYGDSYSHVFGRGDSLQQGEHMKNRHLLEDRNFIESTFVKDGYIEREELMEFFNCSYSFYQKHFREYLNICYPLKSSFSKQQIRIHEFCSSFSQATFNDRTVISPKEVDVFIEKHKLAIEYNGLAFHSYGYSNYTPLNNRDYIDKSYHLSKTLDLESKGISCLHIYENEWRDKQDIWKSMIRHRCGLSRKIGARKTSVVMLSKEETLEFLMNNHLQGNVHHQESYGLLFEGRIVACGVFGKPRYSRSHDFELLRYCNTLNTAVMGGLSKILKSFRDKHLSASVISYANRRWSSGNLYKQLNGKLLRTTPPGYSYIDKSGKFVMSRHKFQKHKLKKLLKVFDSSLTELENVLRNGYRIIYDCGNFVYEL